MDIVQKLTTSLAFVIWVGLVPIAALTVNVTITVCARQVLDCAMSATIGPMGNSVKIASKCICFGFLLFFFLGFILVKL